jgi:hypothetical protein
MSQSATVVSSTDVASQLVWSSDFDFETFMSYLQSFTPAASPVITVNIGTGTAQEAAAWVRYANTIRGYGIQYWQIGNEMEGNWETGGPLSAQDYVRRYVEYYDAMKTADPSIVVLGPVSGSISDPSNLGDGNTFIQDFIGILHAQGLDDHINAVDFHWYPSWNPTPSTDLFAPISQLGALSTSLRSWLSATSIQGNVPVFLTEYNIGLGSPNEPAVLDQLTNGLWVANSLGEFIRYFGNGGGSNLWALFNGSSGEDADASAGNLGYLQENPDNAYQYQPRADYWGMQIMSSDWAIGGDTRNHQLVSATSSQAELATYADLRPDGDLSLVVINRDPANAYSATINLGSFAPRSSADVWTVDQTNYVWETAMTPYHAEPDTAPTHTVYCGASPTTSFTFGPQSVTVIRFEP